MKTGADKNHTSLAICTFELRDAGTDVLMIPATPFRARDGRPLGTPDWHLTDERANAIVAEAANRNTPFIIDYEHQTLHTEKNGQPAPRAARFSALQWRPGDGLYATGVEWTARARQFIADDEYGLISPVFPYDKRTGEVVGFYHAALTNTPAVDAMPDVAAATARFLPPPPSEDHSMNEDLLKLLGLQSDATGEDAVAALTALIKKHDDAAAESVQAIAALKTQIADATDNPDPERWISREAFDELKSEVARLSGRMVNDEVEGLVVAALKDGRLVQSEADWARDLGKKDIESLKGYLETQKPIAALKRTQTEGNAPDAGGDGVVSADEVAVLRNCGLDVEDYKKANGLAVN